MNSYHNHTNFKLSDTQNGCSMTNYDVKDQNHFHKTFHFHPHCNNDTSENFLIFFEDSQPDKIIHVKLENGKNKKSAWG